MHPKDPNRDSNFQGRVRVQLKNDDGSLFSSDFPSRKLDNFLVLYSETRGFELGGGPLANHSVLKSYSVAGRSSDGRICSICGCVFRQFVDDVCGRKDSKTEISSAKGSSGKCRSESVEQGCPKEGQKAEMNRF